MTPLSNHSTVEVMRLVLVLVIAMEMEMVVGLVTLQLKLVRERERGPDHERRCTSRPADQQACSENEAGSTRSLTH